jgi:FHS family glucose/mannose:H+ symporter-like MFS transporter
MARSGGTKWRLTAALYVNFLLFSVVMSSDGILILQVQSHYGTASVAAGILGGCRDMSVAVAALLLSGYVARIGYKFSMLIALALIAAILAWVPLGNSFSTIELMFIVTGIAFALAKASIFSSIALIANDVKHHASTMSYLEATYACGTFAGYFIFSAYGDDAHPHSTQWLTIYYVIAAAAVLAFIWLWTTPVDESSIRAQEPPRETLILDFTAMFRLALSAATAMFVVSIFTYDVLSEGIMKWLPTFNSRILHIPDRLSIELTSLLAGSAVIGRIMGGVAVRFFHWLAVLLVCLVVAAVLVIIALPLAERASTVPIVAWQAAPLAAFIFPLIGLATAPIYPIINSAILSYLPAYQHGAMTGLIMLCSALGATAGSLITGEIFGSDPHASAFYWTLIPIGVLAVSLILLNFFERRGRALRSHHVNGDIDHASASKV